MNVLPTKIYISASKDIYLHNVNDAQTAQLAAFGGNTLTSRGVASLRLDGKSSQLFEFCIADEATEPILGLSTSLKLGLIQLSPEVRLVRPNHVDAVHTKSLTAEDVLQSFSDVFDETSAGDLNVTHHIRIDSDADPVVHAQRRVPEPIRLKVKAKLNEMVHQEIIAPVSEPTDWVGSMVTVLKEDGSVRICLDASELNQVIQREYYTMPTEQEISSRLAGAKKFSKFDTRHGFHHIRLDEESSRLCTFNTPFGRYRW